MISLAKVSLTGVGIKAGKLVVNGQDVTRQVRTVQFLHGPDEVPRFMLELYSDAYEIEGEGIVHVAHGDGVLEFLGSIDPKTLEGVVAERSEWGTSAVQTVLSVLKELAGGDPT